jgi:hypothetical protein
MSQVIRYWVSDLYIDFLVRIQLLPQKVLKHGYVDRMYIFNALWINYERSLTLLLYR